jgi:protein TonB
MDERMLDGMFCDMVDSSWSERVRRGWTTLTSFGLQALVVGMLLLLPILRPSGLPLFHQLSTPISLGQPMGDPEPARPRPSSGFVPSRPSIFIFHRPSPIPFENHPTIDEGQPPVTGSGPYIPGAPANGSKDGIPNLFDGGTRPVVPVAPAPPIPHAVRLSHMSEGDLIRKVQPNYPPLARSARIQGTVLLQAVIGKQGNIENLRVMSGHPMLVQAALDAVRQWRYRPYILNGEPVEVETQITVNFSLSGN